LGSAGHDPLESAPKVRFSPRSKTLRHPHDQLADCVWLPRFVHKARQHLADPLPADTRRAFGHALATDGAFLAHFRLTLPAALAAIAEHPSDEALTRCFLGPASIPPPLPIGTRVPLASANRGNPENRLCASP
jgi:hypothetical protein